MMKPEGKEAPETAAEVVGIKPVPVESTGELQS